VSHCTIKLVSVSGRILRTKPEVRSSIIQEEISARRPGPSENLFEAVRALWVVS